MCISDVRASESNLSPLGEERREDKKSQAHLLNSAPPEKAGGRQGGKGQEKRVPGVKGATIASQDGRIALLIDRLAEGPASQAHRCED